MTLQGERSVGGLGSAARPPVPDCGPVERALGKPGGWPSRLRPGPALERYDVPCTMARMPERAPTIQIPRWIQLVGLPLLLILVWVVAGAVRQVVFLFLVAGLIALLLNPLVRGVSHVRIPRGFSVAIVYVAFVACLIVAIGGIATVIVSHTRTAADRVDAYFTDVHGRPPRTDADRDVDRLQRWLDTHGLKSIDVRERGHKLVKQIRDKDVGKYTDKVVEFVEGAAISIGKLIFSVVLIVVVSIYMLLDMERLKRAVDRRFPPAAGSRPLLERVESAVAGYVRGQFLVSLIIGISAGVGLWILGVLGWLPGGDRYAVLFGGWVAITELIPYIGPWLGAVPPFLYAVVVHPVAAIWVAILFLAIHQIEGHIVVPNVMGSALRLHPLLVIFGLLAGGEIYGLPGVLVALPLLAAARAIWEFFSERVALEPWVVGGTVAVPVGVEVTEPPVPQPETEVVAVAPVAPPEEPPAAATR
jgi:predicted PurR-regulated permease PerM